jgi:hypothetical protein
VIRAVIEEYPKCHEDTKKVEIGFAGEGWICS